MSKALESGKAFVDQILAKLPESLRDSAKTAFAAPEAVDALTLVGDGVLARSDYSRLMDDLKSKETTLTEDYEKLNGWYTTNKEQLEKVGTLEQEIARLSGQRPIVPEVKPPVAGGLTREQLDEILTNRDKGYAGVLAVATTLATKHFQTFGEVADMTAVIDLATKKGLSLEAAHREKYAEQIDAKAKAAEDARIEKLVADRLIDERKKQGTQPFPLRNASPSVLDVIEAKGDPSKYTVDDAVAEYERLQSARG